MEPIAKEVIIVAVWKLCRDAPQRNRLGLAPRGAGERAWDLDRPSFFQRKHPEVVTSVLAAVVHRHKLAFRAPMGVEEIAYRGEPGKLPLASINLET